MLFSLSYAVRFYLFGLMGSCCIAAIGTWMISGHKAELTLAAHQKAITAAELIEKDVQEFVTRQKTIWLGYSKNKLVQDRLSQNHLGPLSKNERKRLFNQMDHHYRKGDEQGLRLLKQLESDSLSLDLKRVSAAFNSMSREIVFAEVFITDRYGMNVAMSNTTSDILQSDEKWWQESYLYGQYVSEPHLDESSGFRSIDVCLRIQSLNNQSIGVMKVVLNLDAIEFLLKTSSLLTTGRVILVHKNGEVLGVSDDGESYDGMLSFWSQQEGVFFDEPSRSIVAKVSSKDEKRALPFDVYVQVSEVSIHQNIKEKVIRLWQIIVVAVLFLSVLGSRLIFKFKGNTEELLFGIAELEKGDWSAKINIDGEHELSKIARSFNQMTTTLQQQKNELVEAKMKADAGNRAKSEFLANMSHELRTPMNAIVNSSQFLKEELSSEEREQWLFLLESSSSSLMKILNDILDHSKIDSGSLQLEHVPFLLKEEIHHVFLLFQKSAEEKGVAFESVSNVQEAVVVEGDPTRFKQVLINLISNALKFTEEGRVQILVEAEPLDQHLDLKLSIKDTGIGMNQEQLSKLFERFEQADTSTTRRFGGTGLGMAISNALVQAMGGRLDVKSQLDEGTTITLNLTFKLGEASMKKKHQAPSTSFHKKGLVAEDNPINQKVLKKILNKMDIDVTFANDGKEAVQLAQSKDFDVIFMDIQMPVMGGLEATQHILKQCPSVPIIAVTANAFDSEHDDYLKSGMVAVVSKPIDKQHLMEVLENIFS